MIFTNAVYPHTLRRIDVNVVVTSTLARLAAKEKGCVNKKCSMNHKWNAAAFCAACGQKIGEYDVPNAVSKIDSYAIAESFAEALYEMTNDDEVHPLPE